MTLDDLRKIAQAATEGPWEYRGDYFGVRQVPTDQHLVGPNKYEMEGIVPGEYIRAEDAEFIATFNPAKVLELIDELDSYRRSLRKVVDRNVELAARLAAVEKIADAIEEHDAPFEASPTAQWIRKAVRGE